MNPFGSSGDPGRRPEAYGPFDRTRSNNGQFGGYSGGQFGGGQYGSGGYGGGRYGGGYGGGQYGGGYSSGGYGGGRCSGGGQYDGYGGGRYSGGQYDGGYGCQPRGYGSSRVSGPFGSNRFDDSGNAFYGRGGNGDRFDRGNGGDRYPRDQYRGEFRRGSFPDVQFDRERRDASGGRRDDRYEQERFMSSRRPGDESYPREATRRTDGESNVNRRFDPSNQDRSPSRSNFRGSVDPENRRSETPGTGPVVRIAAREGSPCPEPRPN